MIPTLALLAAGAFAYSPTPTDGHEPDRVYVAHGQAQAAFQRTAPWQAFIAGEGRHWTVTSDERTGTPLRMWGAGIDLGPVTDAEQVTAALDAFITRNAELLGLNHPITARSVAYDKDFDTWFVDFDVRLDDAPIWRGGLTFRIKHGKLVMAGASTYPSTPDVGSFRITDPISVAVAQGAAPEATHTDADVRRVWLPRMEDGGLVLRAVFEVHSSTQSPRGEWVSFVDGESGLLLASYNEVRHLTGTITAEHDIRFPGSGTTVSPVVGAFVDNASGTVVTGADGSYTLADAPDTLTYLSGDRLDLTDVLGDGAVPVSSQGDAIWDSSAASAAARDSWIFTQQVRTVFNGVVPGVYWTYGNTDLTVNIGEACNAYYDGSLNFFEAGGGCSNTGRLADVVYHEWGHGLHDYSIVSGFFDGAVSEGAGDVVSFLMTGDSQLAPGFFTGGGALRNADNTRRYPEDVVGEVHEDGLIFAGAMWDTTQGIAATEGPEAATQAGRHILAGLLKGGPGLEGTLAEALVADDDDGDLANGTPHECAIVAGFAAHGLAIAGSGGLAAGHEPLLSAQALLPLAVGVNVVGPLQCIDDLAGSHSTVTWRVDGGDWQEAELDAVGADVTGAIPAQASGSFLEYYISVDSSTGTLSAPTQGWRNPYSVYVGEMIEVHCDDFEEGDGGYTHALIAGAESDGADDWQRGVPRGQAGDPDQAYSGTKVWGNDLGRNDFNGEYQNDKHNRLTSPPIALAHYSDTFLHYQRWLRVEDGVYDTAAILANGTEVWNNVDGNGDDHHLEDQWVPHAVSLGNPRDTVEISWEIRSDGGLTLGGWNIDDACVRAPATVNNRLGVSDFTASEGQSGGVSLTWTNPEHAPLEEIRVIRKEGSCPSSVDDGEVVFYDNQPELGATRQAFDPTPTRNTYCYGVFPGDGTDLLGFATLGWNLDEGSASSAATRSEIEAAQTTNGLEQFAEDQRALGNPEYATGCGCSASGGWVGSWVLALALFIRRR